MSEKEIEQIEITCPICKSTHKYSLKVSKSRVFYQMTVDMDTSSKNIKVKRIFTCPNKNKNFQAVIKLVQDFGEIIESVELNNEKH